MFDLGWTLVLFQGKNGEFQGTDEICFNANCKRTGAVVIDQFCIYTICTLRTINYV